MQLENPRGYETTVFETGTQGETVDEPDFMPAGLDDRERFQAQEVWRRLCGALVGGASIAGWHTFMALPGSFAATGLRVDTQPLDERPDIDTSLPRLSWYAYQRLRELLGNDPYTSRMMFPATNSREELDDLLASADVFRDLVVFEFSTGLTGWHRKYVYVMFRDPTVSDRREAMWFRLERGLGAQQVAPFPESREVAVARGCSFPTYDTVTWPPEVAVDDATSIPLLADGTPVVLLAEAPLSFRFTVIAVREPEVRTWPTAS